MSDDEPLGCIDWVAHGFEIVSSVFPRWGFADADAAAAYGMHAALLLGDRHDIVGDRDEWRRALSTFTIELRCGNGAGPDGHAQNVLGGPVKALGYLVREIAQHPACKPLEAGELVTTGTLTEAMRAVPGESWTSALQGIEISAIRLRFE